MTPVCRPPPGTFHPLTRVGLISALRWVRFTRSFPPEGPPPFAAVRIRPVPVTEAALRIVLPNGTRLEVPGRDPEVLRLVVEAVLRQTGPSREER